MAVESFFIEVSNKKEKAYSNISNGVGISFSLLTAER